MESSSCMNEKTDSAMGALGMGGVGEVRGACFQRETLALTPRRYSWRLKRIARLAEPSESSNATTREERLPDW